MKKHGTFTKSMLTGLAVLMLVGIGGWLVRGSNAFYRQDGTVNFAALKSSNNNGALTAQMWDSLIDGIIALDAKVASAPSSGGSQGGGGGTEETPSPSGPIPEECFSVDPSGTLKGYGGHTAGIIFEYHHLWRDRYPDRNEFYKTLYSICPGSLYAPSRDDTTPWDLIIPEKVKGRTIKAIDLDHGAGFGFVRSITIPDSVESILQFPSLGGSSSVYSPEVTLRLGKKVKHIGANTFAGYYIPSIVIPDSVKVIEAGAFSNSRVRSLVLGSGVQTIGDRAFAGHSLSSLVIPDNIRQIGSKAFHGQIIVGTDPIYAPLVHVTLGKGIREIALGVFLDNKSLVSVQMPEGLERIGSCAFAETALTQVDLPSSLQQIERGAFAKGLKRSSTEQILVSDCSNRKIPNRNRSDSNYSPSMLPAVVGYLKKPITEVSNTPEQTNIRLEQVP